MSSHLESRPEAAESKKGETGNLNALVEGAEQQVGTGEIAEASEADQNKHAGEQRALVEGAEQQAGTGEIDEESEPDERGTAEQQRRENPEVVDADNKGEECLDDALDDSFPASDPPSQSVPR